MTANETPALPAIPAFAAQITQALARRYNHLWAQVPLHEVLTGEQDARVLDTAALQERCRELDHPGLPGGIWGPEQGMHEFFGPVITHTSGSKRLTWVLLPPDENTKSCELLILIRRPADNEQGSVTVLTATLDFTLQSGLYPEASLSGIDATQGEAYHERHVEALMEVLSVFLSPLTVARAVSRLFPAMLPD